MTEFDTDASPVPYGGLRQQRGGGSIPGVARQPAFTLSALEPSPIPVLIAVPHAGRSYPPALLSRMRDPRQAALKLEDRYADRLGADVAAATGAAFLVAHAPRAMIDLNRSAEDVDWEMFGQGAPPDAPGGAVGKRARSGLGLIPRRLPGVGEIWKRPHDQDELGERIVCIYQPYHAALAEVLEGLRDRWGAALLIDLHSMPPLPPRSGHRPARIVIGDRFGASCDGRVTAAAFTFLAEAGAEAAHNRPYSGGYVIERHAAMRRGVHALQVEIDRSSYLDSRLAEPGAGFEPMVRLLSGLVRRLAAEAATLGSGDTMQGWAEAAE